MAAENLPWDEETDQFITNIDRQVVQSYGISLRELLLNPDRFASMKDIGKKVDDIKAAVDNYFDKMRESMKEEQERFDQALEFADSQYAKIDGVISTKASLSRVPYVKPAYIDSDPTIKEEIFVEQYNNGLDALIGKMVNISNYIADVSTAYGKYNIGSWLFSGQRSYVITVSTPTSVIMVIDKVNEEIGEQLDSVYDRLALTRK